MMRVLMMMICGMENLVLFKLFAGESKMEGRASRGFLTNSGTVVEFIKIPGFLISVHLPRT